MGVALTPCTVPSVGKPGFSLGDEEVELGLGIHGEPGVRRAPLETADALVGHLLDAILAARRGAGRAGNRVALLVNGLGGTTPLELAIVARSALARLAAAGLIVERAYAGTFLSALEMGGVSLSVLDLDDARLARLDAPTLAPAWPNAAPTVRVDTAPPADRARSASRPERTQSSRKPPPASSSALAIARAARALIADAGRLTDLDQAVGDGDLGISLARGADAVLAALPGWPCDDPAATFRALADTLQRALGGSSGPFYAVACLRAGAACDAPAAPADSRWVAALGAAIAGIEQLGGAHAGDRTMLDALIPAHAALIAAFAAGQPFAAAGRAAAAAAQAGAIATARMHPRQGRSSYLGVRALGHPDPGAEAVATWLRALAEPT